nr:hypothetical protein [Tanacetum cinerariifolium]
MFERVRAFIRGDVAIGSAEMILPSQGDKGYIHLTWTGGPKKYKNRGGPREARRNIGGGPMGMQIARKGARFEERGLVLLEKIWDKEDTEEVCIISHERPAQHVMMGTTLTTNCKQLLTKFLQENIEEYNQIKMTEDDEEKTGFHTKERVYCFTHMPNELKNSAATLQRMIEEVVADQRGWNVEIYLEAIVINAKTNEAKKALKRIKIKLNKLQTLGVPKEGEILMLCLRQKDEIISSVLLVEREGIQIPVSYLSRPLQGMKICYILTKKMVQGMIHTTRSLRAFFRKHKVKVITDGTMEEILKLFGKEGRLAVYDISYIPRKEAKGSVVKKFFGQGEQVEETSNANEGGTLNLSMKLQAKSTPTPRA